MNLTRLVATTSAFLFAAFMAVGCAQEQGPAERTGAAIDEAVEDAQDAAQDAAREVERSVEDAAREVERSVEDATN